MTKHHKAVKTSLAISLSLIVSVMFPLLSASPVAGAPGNIAAPAAAPVDITANYVTTIDTFSFSPPAPDPSGITFLGGTTLLISDTEVEEVTFPMCAYSYAGTNTWTVDTETGVGTARGNTIPYSSEPTGIDLKNATTMIVSDDDADRITTVTPGGDSLLGTADDAVTSVIPTGGISSDNEGVAWNPTNSTLNFISGEPPTQSRVYSLNEAGVLQTSFLVAEGISQDSQGIAKHDGRNTFLVTDDSNQVFEFDQFGTHISTMMVNPPASANTPGHTTGHTLQGIAIVPDSGDTYRLFIADRRADPGNPPASCDTNLNDGQIHEWTVTLPDDRDPSVSITTPATGSTFGFGQSIAFTGVATDETGTLTNLMWTSSRDGALGSGSTINVSNLTAGAHTITASATANGDTGTDAVNITVTANQVLMTPGVTRGNIWYFNNGFDGAADFSLAFGRSTDKQIPGDWNGDGIYTPGIVRGNLWYLSNDFNSTGEIIVNYGRSTDTHLAGDFDNNGTMTPVIVRGNLWYFNNGFDGAHDFIIAFGRSTDKKVVGDWDGNGTFTPGIIRGNLWYLSNDFNSTGEIIVNYGKVTDTHIPGDWDGNGTFTPGIVRGNVWYLNNGFDGAADRVFAFARSTDGKIAGDWNG